MIFEKPYIVYLQYTDDIYFYCNILLYEKYRNVHQITSINIFGKNSSLICAK